MNLEISKKVIIFSFLFINLIQSGKSADLVRTNKRNNNLASNNVFLKKLNNKKSSVSFFHHNFKNFFYDKQFLEKNSEHLLAGLTQKEEELIIQSDKQSEINDTIYAEGDVSVSYKGKLLKADTLIYDKLSKKISAKGNIVLLFGDQFFKVEQLEYSFISKKGYLLDVEGSINTSTFMDDLSSNFSLPDSNKIKNLLKFKKKEILNTPNKVENCFFSTDKISIDGQKWESKKALFSNDLLELKQVKLAINS